MALVLTTKLNSSRILGAKPTHGFNAPPNTSPVMANRISESKRFISLTNKETFNINNLATQTVPMAAFWRAFVTRLIGVTVAANTYDAAIEGTLTLFQWG